MPRKIDRDGYLVMNLGVLISHEHYLMKHFLSVKSATACYSDGAALLGGFIHLGLRARIFTFKKHQLSGGMGPTLVFREMDVLGWLCQSQQVQRK